MNYTVTKKYIDAILQNELKPYPEIANIFEKCFYSTLDTTTELLDDGTTYVFTGDIPAMWLRDSSVQVSHYVDYCCDDPDMCVMIKGLIERQFRYIIADPYANAFNKEANGAGHQDDLTEQNPLVWERKYEIDSLCFPVWIAYKYYKKTADKTVFDGSFMAGIEKIIELFKREQDHVKNSSYSFVRTNAVKGDYLPNAGNGYPVNVTGMTWSGFRPSDDACKFGYLVPANLFAVTILRNIEEILCEVFSITDVAKVAELREDIQDGVDLYGTKVVDGFGKIYAFETDGFGNYNFMDDANVPSLLSLPYLGYCDKDDEIYQNTRRFALSKSNPFYREGKFARGIGSPHTPNGFIWHIGLVMEALTTDSKPDITRILGYLLKTTGGTNFMHEGFNPDEPHEYTREWFAWANTMFAILILKILPDINEIASKIK